MWTNRLGQETTEINYYSAGGNFQHFFEAAGSCVGNPYRFAAYTSFNAQGTLEGQMPEMRNRDVAIDCPYFEFCYGEHGHCITGKSTLGTCKPGTLESMYDYMHYDISF